jgi:hypothetical protein
MLETHIIMSSLIFCLTLTLMLCLALCHTPVQEGGTEASIHVPKMFKSHIWQQYNNQMQCSIKQSKYLLHNDPWV